MHWMLSRCSDWGLAGVPESLLKALLIRSTPDPRSGRNKKHQPSFWLAAPSMLTGHPCCSWPRKAPDPGAVTSELTKNSNGAILDPTRFQSTYSNRKINTIYLEVSSCWAPLITPFYSSSREVTTIHNKHKKTCFLFSGITLLKVLSYPLLNCFAFNILFRKHQWTSEWAHKFWVW